MSNGPLQLTNVESPTELSINTTGGEATLQPSLSEMQDQARQAFVTGHHKTCVQFISVILKADPDNKEALDLREKIRATFEEDLGKLGIFLQDPTFGQSPELWERAERSLRTVLDSEAEHDSAASLPGAIEYSKPPVPGPINVAPKLTILKAGSSWRLTELRSATVLGLIALVITAGIVPLVTGGLGKRFGRQTQPSERVHPACNRKTLKGYL